MSELSMPDEPAPRRRRYDSPARRRQAEATRDGIVSAGAELVRGFASWDWDGLTFRSVAQRAGVSERTVYRHFPSERHLHDAVMQRLESEAGISYEDVELTTIADVTARVIAAMHRFAVDESVRAPGAATFVETDHRRQVALLRAVTEHRPAWTDEQRRVAAGLLDAIWSPTVYERLVKVWKVDEADALAGVQWLIAKVVAAVDSNEPIGSVDHQR